MVARMTMDSVTKISWAKIVCLLAMLVGWPAIAAEQQAGSEAPDAYAVDADQVARGDGEEPSATKREKDGPSPFEPAPADTSNDEGASISGRSDARGEEPPAEAIRGRSTSAAAVWPIAAICLLLVGLIFGAMAMATIIYWRRGRDLNLEVPTSGGDSPTGPVEQSDTLVRRASYRFQSAKNGLLVGVRRVKRTSQARLRSLIPSRETVLRGVCLLFGSGLVVLSLIGFTAGRILESSILLPIGYAIAASVWLFPWKRKRSGPDSEETAYLKASAQSLAAFAPQVAPAPAMPTKSRPAAIRPMARTSGPMNSMIQPGPHFGFSIDTAISPPPMHEAVPSSLPLSAAAPADDAVRLQCVPCGKQFNVRGQGEIGFRLVPCPECGHAMETVGAKPMQFVPNDPSWVPIVSVFCKGCRSLIDVPYAAMGTSIPCPRCRQELHVPQVRGESPTTANQDQLVAT